MALTDAEANIENGSATLTGLTPPESGDWVGVGAAALPVEAAWRWAILPGCGGIVTFCGTVRDHSDGRPGVTGLEYEAYVEQVAPRLTRVATAARERWEEIGRLVLPHRVGRPSRPTARTARQTPIERPDSKVRISHPKLSLDQNSYHWN